MSSVSHAHPVLAESERSTFTEVRPRSERPTVPGGSLAALEAIGEDRVVAEGEGVEAGLEHNRDEEKEHAAMVLEWIRRQDPRFDKELKDYLFTDKPIAHE